MAQVRVEKTNDFTQIENKLIQNPDLSLKAKGLLIYMLSVPDDWDYSISGLSVKCKEGKSSIRSAIAELMEYGYITRTLTRADHGVLSGYEYVVYEKPHLTSEMDVTGSATPSCDFPTTDNPTTGNPSSENCTQQIYNQTNKNKTNTYSAPAKSKKTKSVPSYFPDGFDTFWKTYPRKDAKQAAIKAWDKLKPDKDLCRAMYVALLRNIQSSEWNEQQGRFIPYFSKWLNQRLWENEGVDISLLPQAQDNNSGGWAADPEVY